MENSVAIIIIGIYTIVYLVVFIIQRSQINKMKSINDSITTFINIFDLNKLKEYTSIIEKSSDVKVELLQKEFGDKMNKLSKIIIDNSYKNAEEYFTPKMNEMKSYILARMVLTITKTEERKKIVEKFLPENKDSFIYLLERLDENKTS